MTTHSGNLQTILFGKDTKEAVQSNTCVTCPATNVAKSLRATVDLREYFMSGMCQRCQDAVFTKCQD